MVALSEIFEHLVMTQIERQCPQKRLGGPRNLDELCSSLLDVNNFAVSAVATCRVVTLHYQSHQFIARSSTLQNDASALKRLVDSDTLTSLQAAF